MPSPSILRVARGFETQLAKAGFWTLIAYDTDACAQHPVTEDVDVLPIFPRCRMEQFRLSLLCRPHRQRIAAARLSQRARLTEQQTSTRRLVVAGERRDRRRDRRSRRHRQGFARPASTSRFFSIYFDTDEAVRSRPGGRPTLEEDHKLLRRQLHFNIVIVGHADDQGRPAGADIDLSRGAPRHRRQAHKIAQIVPARLRTAASVSSRRSAPTPARPAARSTAGWSWWRRSRRFVSQGVRARLRITCRRSRPRSPSRPPHSSRPTDALRRRQARGRSDHPRTSARS